MQVAWLTIEHPDGEANDRQRRVEVIYHAEQPDTGKAAAFPLVELESGELETVLLRWFQMYADADVRTALSRFFAGGYRTSYLEHRVTDIAGVLEALASSSQDRIAIVPKAITEDLLAAFDKIAESAGLDRQAKGIVRTRLKGVADPSLKQRIESLLEPVMLSITSLVAAPNRYARRITDVRNPLAHGGGLPVDADEAFWLTRAGHFVVVALLLDNLGINSDRVTEALSRVPAYSWACEQCQSYSWGASHED